MTSVSYQVAGQTLESFFASDDFVRVLVGPFGSGKTAACCAEAFRRVQEQAPDADGVRRSKGVVIRSTYRQLQTTTAPSWRGWFGDAFGDFTWSDPFQHRMRFGLPDGTRVEADIVFLALDGPDAETKLRGLEVTWGWVNEAREIPKSVFNFLLGRVGRYPPMRAGGPTWSGVFADSNAWDADHWLSQDIAGWRVFKQPGGVTWDGRAWVANPAAENLINLPAGYYQRQIAGQTEAWIRVYLANEYGFSVDGKPVYPEFVDSMHVPAEPLAPLAYAPVTIGVDFGLSPAAVFCQLDARGRWRVLGELVAEDMGATAFARLLIQHVQGWFPGQAARVWGDPAGAQRAQTDERTCLEVIRSVTGLPAHAAPTNSFLPRREAVAGALGRLIEGTPGLMISPACKVLRKGFAGGYHYRRLKVAGDERYHDEPNKNAFSHVHDALQYALSGGGETLRPRSTQGPIVADTAFKVLP